MKKRLLSILLAGCMVASLTACGEDKEAKKDDMWNEVHALTIDETREALAATPETAETVETEETIESETEEETVETETEEEKEVAGSSAVDATRAFPTEMADDVYAFQIKIDDVIYQLPMWYEEFATQDWTLIRSDIETELKSNAYSVETFKKDELAITVRIANLSANTTTFAKSEVSSIKVENYDLKKSNDCTVELPKGIVLGKSTSDDVEAAYGTPSDVIEASSTIKYTYKYDYYQEVDLRFDKETKVLDTVEVENMIELEGADNSVNEEVPDAVKAYAAPKAVSDNPFDFAFELEGHTYSLPCPVSEFVNNGMKIKSDLTEGVSSGGYERIELTYDNQNYSVLVTNRADYATIPENCWVTSFKVSVYGPTWDINTVGGISIGSSEKDLVAFLDGTDGKYEKDEEKSYTSYKLIPKDETFGKSYYYVVREGKVDSIEMENRK